MKLKDHRFFVLEKEPPSIESMRSTHDFIYGRIEALNYLLYRRTGEYDPTTATDILSGPKSALRWFCLAMLHLLVWGLIVMALAGAYILYVRNTYWPALIVASAAGGGLLLTWIREILLQRQLRMRLAGKSTRASKPENSKRLPPKMANSKR